MTDPATGEDVEYDYAYYDDTVPESPFVNPYDPSHQQPQLLAGNLAGQDGNIFCIYAALSPDLLFRFFI